MKALLAKVDKRPVYPVGRVNGVVGAPLGVDDFDSSDSDDEHNTKEYEQEFVREEMSRYFDPVASQTLDNGTLSQVDTIATEHTINRVDVYEKHNFRLKTDIKKDLPIDGYKSMILSRVEFSQVTVIEGPTGCGKTTQVPQMIMDSYREKGQYCNIVVTQPRKIATINVAKRVCEERGWSLGVVCGYQVGLEKEVSRDVIITYMTIGVLLQKLIRAKSLREYTHIIIDEVHERNQELDFLLLIVRKFLFTNSIGTRVVLMSATMNSDEFAHYFRKQSSGKTIPAPIIKVDTNSQYKKTIFPLDLIWQVSKSMPKFDIEKPEISKEIWEIFTFLIEVFDKLDADGPEEGRVTGSVLVFLPGINEIEEAHRLLKSKDSSSRRGLKWEIVPLHSSLPNDEQAKAFKPSPKGFRKIILSTNIAESSITVADIGYVIDFCLTKVMTVADFTNYMCLKLEWASHVNCDQRAGRVGRTCDGRVYRLVTKRFYNEEMSKTSQPEILRAPLNRIVLQSKMLELNETPSQILALAMAPPNLKNIETTISQLKEIGGLLKTCRGVLSSADGDITFLGRVMASLPIDVHLAKMIVLGQLYSCLDETVIIAAGCSVQNIFSIPFQKRLEAYKKLLLWADGSNSDLIALLNLYTVWQNLKRENAFQNQRQELEWCHRNLVSLKGLKEWHLLVTEIRERLTRLEIKETAGPGKVVLSRIEKPTVLKVVMAGAFYPNYFIKTSEGKDSSEREAVKVVGGRDPFSTVYFTGFDPKQPGQIYVKQIKKMIEANIEKNADIHVGFDGSMKIYVEFKNAFQRDPVAVDVDGSLRLATASGRIPSAVYEMIRQRQLRYEFKLKLLDPGKAWEFAEKHGVRREIGGSSRSMETDPVNCFTTFDYSPIPTMDTQYARIHISNHIDAGHFWVQNDDARTNELLQKIDEALNRQVLNPLQEPPKVGALYAARFKEDGLFYRCKVLAVGGRINQILFVDYGNVQEVRADELYIMPQRPQCLTPPLAYECALVGVRPAYRYNPAGVWSDAVNENFCKLTSGLLLFAEVYSVVNDLVEIYLYRSEKKDVSMNDYLLNNGFAEPCNPSFLSKQNHEQRAQVQASGNPFEEARRLDVDTIASYSDFADPLRETGRFTLVDLRGPFSPLEAKLFACTAGGSGRGVDIEGSSVNAVLLDTEPDSPHARLLVAAHVGQTAGAGKLMLRQTTLLPNVPGFPMLLTTIFCPTMEAKLTEDNSLVAAVLCGLGYNKSTNKALYPADDILLRLDTELQIDELEKINKLRYLMNTGLKLMGDVEQNRSSQNELLHTQVKIREHLFGLINMERTPIDRITASPTTTSWGIHGGLGMLRPNLTNEDQDVWELLLFLKLADMNGQQREVTKNLETIQNMLYNAKEFEPIKCLLCNIELSFLHELRFHVISEAHESKEQEFNMEMYDEEDDSDERE
ncbi:probable ATP-dependent RNA helicase spindle-E [Sitophilus oryzae]|uniref:Probable ATP-dependent RNA helicase spindle-E n=1 Tax=Sitophilus oryzae TaxID=7048 RepID=A0A6J2YDX7_SITOR|nr:probable ATP-dependent RNA helicase spindle-E [Sitophilus oryzae]